MKGCGDMATRRGGRKLTPRFFAIVLAAACVFVSVTMMRDNACLTEQRAAIAELEERRSELKERNEQLKCEAEFSRTDEFIEREARMRGMLRPGETRYVLDTGVNFDNAQGGN